MSAKKGKMGSGGMRKTRRTEKQPKEDPMKNELILESIFGYLGVSDLKVVREVSPLWRDCARKKWNKSVTLKIRQVQECRYTPEGNLHVEKYQQFLQMVGNEQFLPLGRGIQGNWTALCAQIKALELGSITLPTIKSLRKTLFVCFPNLENLTLKAVHILKVERLPPEPTVQQALNIRREDQQRNLKSLEIMMTKSLPISWTEVLAHFPCLEAINVELCGTPNLIFQAVNQIREEDPSKLNLKHVIICADSHPETGNIAPATLATLMDRRLQLETLGIRGIFGRHVVSSFRDVLQIHAGTLKKLVFLHRPDEVTFPQEFPELKNLQELDLALYHSLESIALLKFTPNLRRLALDSIASGRLRHTNLAQFPVMLSTCKELEIRVPFPIEDMKTLVEWIPNLEILKIGSVDNAMFALICEHWSNLVELYVRGSRVDTSGITGWDEEDVKRLDSMRRPKNAAVPPWRPITVPRANITCLKNLQIFTMTGVEYPKILLTRAAGIYGIEMLPDLRRLRFENYKIKPKDRDYWKGKHEQYPCPL